MISSLPTLTERPNAWCGALLIQAPCSRLLSPEQQSGGLRTANAFAAAIGHGRGAARQVNIGLDGEDFGRGIHQHGDVSAAGRLGNHLSAQRPVVARSGQNVAHGRTLVEGGFEFGLILHDDEFDAQHADGVIVDLVRVGWNDGFVLQSGKVGEALHAFRIAAGDGGGGEVSNRGAATGGHDSPLGAGDLGQALADAIHQLVHVDEAARRLVHGALDFGKSLRSGDDRERPACIDHGAHTDGAIHVGADFERGRHRLPDAAAEGLGGGEQSALAEQIPAAVSRSTAL